MALATWAVAIDLENDGDFTGAGEDVTAKVRPADGSMRLLEVKRGNDPSGRLHLPRASSAVLELNNDDQAYAPGGTLKLGRAARVQATFSAVTYDLFRGTLERPTYPPPTVGRRRQVHLDAVGPFAGLVGKKVSTALYSSVAVGTAIGHLLDAAGFSGSMRDLDTGQAVMDYWWLDEEDAFSALLTLLITEGAGARLYERGDGYIVFKDRHAHLLESASTTVQTTFRSAAGGTEPLLSAPFVFADGIQDVVNDVRREVVTRAVGSVGTVWTGPATITLGPSQSASYRVRSSGGDPLSGAIAPTTGGGDYTVVSGAVSSVTLNRTSGGNVTVTVTADTAGCTISGLRLRASLVTTTAVTLIANTYSTSTSQAEYGVRTFPYTPRKEVPITEAEGWCNEVAILLENGIPYASIPVRTIAADARMTAALVRQVAERIRVIETEQNIDEEMIVDAVEHYLDAPNNLRAVVHARQAYSASPFILGTSALDSSSRIWA